MRYVKERIVEECFHRCHFFNTDVDGMKCNHPYFEDKKPYENMIITQNNSHGRVPDECPLRKESVEVVVICHLRSK